MHRNWRGGMYGVRKLNKIAFEGGMSYRNIRQEEKKWNSTLFVDRDNPFVLGDSLAGDFTVETFHLFGGFALAVSSRWQAALRVVYDAGSSADESDPRPDTKAMKFLLNPGVNYVAGNWTLGASAGIGWLSESIAYTAVKTIENYQLFLFRGLGINEMKQAIGYERKYRGNHYRGAVQLGWTHRGIADFLELGYEKGKEEATDGGSSQKYKGGKYERTAYRLMNRLQLKGERIVHNLTLQAVLNQVEGIWYIQKQQTDADGNVVWEVKNASVCYKEDRAEAGLVYRMDVMKEDIPGFTWSLRTGYIQSEATAYPDLQKMKYSQLQLKTGVNKQFHIKESVLGIGVQGGYEWNLSRSARFDRLVLAPCYTSPLYDYLSASRAEVQAELFLKYPLRMKDFNSWIKVFAGFSGNYYLGNAVALDRTKAQNVKVGVNYIF